MSSDEHNSSNKRTRASGEVLDYLLQEFESNQNPSPEQRKDISDRTNMTEKAVRIWFQNRRAKMRKFERMGKSPVVRGSSSIQSSRSSSFGMAESSGISKKSSGSRGQGIPVKVNEKYSFIDCSSLSVGSWQRIKTGYHDEGLLRNSLHNLSPFTLNKVMAYADLLVLLSRKNMEINYFFSAMSNNSRILFRIFYPVSSILSCSLLDNNINKGNNEIRVCLSHQPKFSVYFFNGVNSQNNQWNICEDFSEGQQVSSAYYSENGTSIPHVLVGVKSSLQYLNAFIMENQSVPQPQTEYRPPITLNDPPIDAEEPTGDNFQFNAGQNVSMNIWENGNKSPLGLDSDPSPTSINSMSNNLSSHIPNDEHLPSSSHSQTSDQNEPYSEIFSSHASEFFSNGQTPTSTVLNPTVQQASSKETPKTNANENENDLIHSPSTELHSYTHHQSPFPTLDGSTTFPEGVHPPNNETSFEFTDNNFNLSSSVDNSNGASTTPANNQMDSFIDYNSGFI
ncbi:Piso0_000127 [Millerozyma farinosa CBS 7064]|uniref:Piso0_000127 protein n=1 Tax=Pichia sorbitophila (strain ATCC MYA-4447 / BCRC 22081 / CBS 7064 / NBRC 10061 / NRRL Y-12695) TaxID=559304 RepID=G8YUL2_PICSO|nr:Piso0_000127 [Millerozyma farinosa CBS 7064]